MITLKNSTIPQKLQNISSPPKQLFVEGELSKLLEKPIVAIVGSRGISNYGRAVTERFASDLAGQGIVVISGLAFGVDAAAHKATLAAGGQTIAVLPSPVDKIYPASHHNLAKSIVEQGGALISEYESGSEIFKGNFVARNRIIAGLADGTLITEAALKSGSLHTARYAMESGREVMAVPGNINSTTSVGTNNLIKTGAAPVTSAEDALFCLGLQLSNKPTATPKGANQNEQTIIDLLTKGLQDGNELQQISGLSAEDFNQTLTMLEISGKIRSLGSNQWAI